jgi:hypothetical protein
MYLHDNQRGPSGLLPIIPEKSNLFVIQQEYLHFLTRCLT